MEEVGFAGSLGPDVTELERLDPSGQVVLSVNAMMNKALHDGKALWGGNTLKSSRGDFCF